MSLLQACNTANTSFGNTTKTVTVYTISGTVQQTTPYCGGANPGEEILKMSSIPTPYPGKIFYVRSGDTNNSKVKELKKIITDEKGNFSLKLPPGIYSIIVEEQLNEINAAAYETKDHKVDRKCLADWWKKPYYILEVKKQNITSLNFVFNHRCYIDNDIPCVRYKGPPHP